ncbi:MAG: fumarate hydratase [Candidatus Baldrarchaeia archaeon]
MINLTKIEDVLVGLIGLSVVALPDDVKFALKEAYRSETNELARHHLKAILENIRLAESLRRPICQDTGTLTFFMRANPTLFNVKNLIGCIKRATARATREIPLRPNAVDVLTGVNSGDNTGRHIPIIHTELDYDIDFLEISILPKGGGSENVSRLFMINPAEGLEGVKRVVIRAVAEAGGKPCPPTIVGVGIGGSADLCMKLAKKALLRPINVRNPVNEISKLEMELLEEINKLEIGPMGLGGKTTSLAVNIEVAHRHPASFPVGIIFQCWAARRVTARIYWDGSVDILSHRSQKV